MKKFKRAMMIGTFFANSLATHAALPGNSIYQIGSVWTNQAGQTLELKDLAGKPVILSMVYLSCKLLCPTVISEIEALDHKLDTQTRARTQIILVTFDPENDTPEIMRAYLKKRKLDEKRWTFLTNKNESKIRELAAALGFKYQKDPDGEFTHSFMIFALDSSGVVRAFTEQAAQDKRPLIQSLEKKIP